MARATAANGGRSYLSSQFGVGMIMKRTKGQSMVELGLILPIFIGIIVLTADIFFVASNSVVAKLLTSRGSRAAALSTMTYDISCLTRVTDAIGTPPLFLVDPWTWEVSPNCSSDPLVGISQSEAVAVTINFTVNTNFLGAIDMEITSQDYGR